MYTVSDYLIDVIKFMGNDHVFGVPGDYNLEFLDHIVDRNDMTWVGNANELNAAYMADGYAKKTGFAALVTTFGVGDLSSDNGLAGSLAENVPVLSIVGAPKTENMDQKLLVHHTFGDGEFEKFTKMHEVMGLKVKDLTAKNTVDDINEIVKYIIKTGKPAYLTLPIDVAKIPVNPSIKESFASIFNRDEEVTEFNNTIAERLVQAINNAKHPLVLVGHELKNRQLAHFIERFVVNNNLLFTDLGLGKCALNESLPQFIGTYSGALTDEPTKQIVDQADLVINFGAKLTDFVTSMFTQSFTEEKIINISNDDFDFFGSHRDLIGDYSFYQVVKAISDKQLKQPLTNTVELNPISPATPSDKVLTQDFYDRAVINSIKPGQTLVAESGTSFSGLSPFTLPDNVDFSAQPLWASIGYAFPSMIGGQLADNNSRHVLSTGEGSLQLTIQELGTLIKHNLHPIMLVIDNNGYTVERLIHGMKKSYNDVAKLDYTLMPQAFGAKEEQFMTFDVNTESELVDALNKAQSTEDKFVLIQVHMDQEDAPSSLTKMGEMIQNKNN
ncbi:Pyruvate decarboxylase, alpha-keto-acid decarboxylase [Apilactobacillus kunkeei]|uniref:alpha-keto acid decarboxylase family protein n=1 Tax=Apilactobacillus kunkeei TaxID=148814 RepID=UPI0006CE93CC|nr:thiamine pyrophosphate-binding protein [Apilactobacillus kunkeei]KPN83074.1 Pyruvate decarboxylase, alpha-keto-acid decarboxylase [Apilactobacillus kunkeei]